MIGNRSDNRRHGTGFKPTFRRRISRIKSLDTWWYVAGCVYMVGVTRTRPIFDLDRIRERERERSQLALQRN